MIPIPVLTALHYVSLAAAATVLLLLAARAFRTFHKE